jgi:hypothetical protein
VIEPNGAVEAKRLGPASKARDAWLPKHPDPPQIVGLGVISSFDRQPLVMAFTRTQHHPVFAEGDRLLVLIGSDMSDGRIVIAIL